MDEKVFFTPDIRENMARGRYYFLKVGVVVYLPPLANASFVNADCAGYVYEEDLEKFLELRKVSKEHNHFGSILDSPKWPECYQAEAEWLAKQQKSE